MTEPRVSVLIPTYNRAAYLREAIGSALGQTFRDIEVVIVDDGSTDGTAKIVREITDPRVRYLWQANHGVAAALNTAWHAARGEYLARLDSDDVWLPDLLAQFIATLDADPGLGLVYARAQWMDAQGNLLPQILGAPEKFPGQWLKSLLYGDFVCPIAVMFRRTCIERAGGYDESLIGNEDWDLWIRMAEHCRFAYRNQILARYRVHAQNLTSSVSEQSLRLFSDRIRVLEKFFARSDVPAEVLAIKPLAFRNVYLDIAMRHFTARHWHDGFDYSLRAIRVGPNPLTSAMRVITAACFYFYLSKTRWGVRLVDALIERRRKTDRVSQSH
jgi:glycosyltransferase involved in cell wall biosynthesis